ncbi:unnamed protein product [Cylicostephanus goldi]|uniref:Enolase-phosphatase E1 n=1 Tax=Cylicostephanus goldi TaxID=71465 RepID=A0A3P7MB54_CYLGO|nr:unnamed protein product [Cylicostephanus goldi]
MPAFSYLLLDIEGTITSISFVKDVLFPCAHKGVEQFLREHFDDDNLTKIIDDIREISQQESRLDTGIRTVRTNKEECIEDVTRNVRHWIDIDKKVTPMKALQGLIWEEAYIRGDVKGHVYPDVLPSLKAVSVPVYIYSSGSVLAQKLLFKHSVVGDMTKLTPMKALQGLIWEEAYKRGDVKGQWVYESSFPIRYICLTHLCSSVYPDVLPSLKMLSVPVYIYSSGSVLAQKLLFEHSVVGDMTKILSGYFDTNVGLKGDSQSYKKICEQIGAAASEVLFLTDVEAEARAARSAGLQTMLVVREGNAPLSENAKQEFKIIYSLEELIPK